MITLVEKFSSMNSRVSPNIKSKKIINLSYSLLKNNSYKEATAFKVALSLQYNTYCHART